MKAIIKFRIFLWAILGIVVLWLFYMGIVPSGKITYVYNFKKATLQLGSGQDYFIQKLTPKERVGEILNGAQKIIGDPVYFSLRTPRKFNKAKLTVKFKNESQRPIIEAGVLADKTIWRYELNSVQNKIIDNLVPTWDTLRDNGGILLQRKESLATTSVKYENINDFINKPPDLNKVALYNYELKADFLLPNYASSTFEDYLEYAFRGPYQFYTYLKNEDFDFTFIFKDINFNRDSDPIDVILYYNNQMIDSRHLDDDGIAKDSGEERDERELEFKIPNLPEGAYKIEVRANDDIITNGLKTKQSKLSFIYKIWLSGSNLKKFSLYTDSRELKAQTINPASLQKIKVDNMELDMNETYKQFSLNLNSKGIKKIEVDKDDVIIAGDGVFSFGSDSLINPQIKKVDVNFNPLEVEYIAANYQEPVEENGWSAAQVEIDLAKAYREDGKYSFIISIPGLKADDEIEDYIEIGEIRVELVGKSLWRKIGEMLN